MNSRSLFFFPVFLILTALALESCAALPDNSQRTASYAPTDTGASHWAQKFKSEKSANRGRSGFVPLDDGLDAFVARATLANQAEHSIDAQYYLWHNDLVGRLLLGELAEAADRGVRVRLLIDDIGLRRRDHHLQILSTHPNFEVRVFNPFSRLQFRATQYLSRLGSVTRRMHNKSFTVDKQVTVIGGRNIGNEYFEADPQITFGDLDALTIGSTVDDVSASFDLYWNNALAYPITTLYRKTPTSDELARYQKDLRDFALDNSDSPYVDALINSKFAEDIKSDALTFYWGEARLFVDAPEKIAQTRRNMALRLTSQFEDQLQTAEQELIIISPYFIPGLVGTQELLGLAKNGVRVQILTNSLASNNHAIVHAKYAKYRKPLLAAGVDIYEARNQEPDDIRKQNKAPFGTTKSTVLHAKSFIIDRKYVFIGSLNFDPRSFAENTEIGVVFESATFANYMAQWVDDEVDTTAYRLGLETNANGDEHIVWHDGAATILRVEPDTTRWKRAITRILSWLPVESQL